MRKYREDEDKDTVDNILLRISRLEEAIKTLTERIERIENELKTIRQQGEIKPGKKKGIEIVKERGVVFESDLKNIRDKDKYFSYLERHGVFVINCRRERIAVTKEYLDKLMRELSKYRGPGEAERKLRGDMKKLYIELRESGYLVYDRKTGWTLSI